MPTAPQEPVLLVDREDGVATFTLNRPAAMNALSRELRRAIAAAFRAIAEDADVGAVIVTGNGRAFCAGLDLKELGGETADEAPGTLLGETDMMSALRACAVPVIGAVNGFAITGGFELALACDILIASSHRALRRYPRARRHRAGLGPLAAAAAPRSGSAARRSSPSPAIFSMPSRPWRGDS